MIRKLIPSDTIAVRAIAPIAAAIAVFGATQPLAAQTLDPRWQPWIGCWSPDLGTGSAQDISRGDSQRVCVTPAATGSGVDIATVTDGKVVQSERLEVTGTRVAKTRDGCSGWEIATWAANAHRVLLRSEFTCPGGAVRKSSGILAMSQASEFLQVHGVAAGSNVAIRVAVFQEAASRNDSAGGIGFSALTAKLAASGEVMPSEVLEASKLVDAPVVEAWLTELGQDFKLDGKQLVTLADGGMPPRVIDLMIALSNPKTFAIRKTRLGAVSGVENVASNNVRDANMRYGRAFPMNGFDPYGDAYFPYGGSGLWGYGYSPYRNFGLNAFGYGFGGYGYGSPWWGINNNYGYYSGSNPIVIIDRNNAPAQPQGRAVYGSGYTRPAGGSSSGSASPSSGYSAPRSSGSSSGSSSGGASSGGSSGGASGNGGGGGRTAKPRGSGI